MTASKESNEELTRRVFAGDVAKHEMTVLRDDGLYRHLHFRNPSSICHWFEVVTWPGALAIRGNMGCYVFSRIEDMFEFFRCDSINPSYWVQKLVATCTADGHEEFSHTRFEERIREWFDDYCADNTTSAGQRERLWERVVAEVLRAGDPRECVGAALAFEHDGDYPFADFWEVNCNEYAIRYLWCCHAIVWAIQQYDARIVKVTVCRKAKEVAT